MGEYIPSAPVNDEGRKQNQNLPGMGGVFNHVNLHAYHYAGNNPVKYTDPDGNEIKVQIHNAFRAPSVYHASIKITLDTPELRNAFQNNEKFVEHGLTDSNGNQYITIGGEARRGLLHGMINRRSDVQEANKRGSYLITGVDEVAAVGRILGAFEAYKNDLKYDLLPGLSDGYNSNSYIRGILRSAELPRNDFYRETSNTSQGSPVHDTNRMNLPGWNKPIPISTDVVE
jgi:hypothetical protein